MLPCSSCRRVVLDAFLDHLSIHMLSGPTRNRHAVRSTICCPKDYTTVVQGDPSQVPRPVRLMPGRGSSKGLQERLQQTIRISEDKQWRPKVPNLSKELRYLNDPVKLAKHVVNLLAQDKGSTAEELVRAASRGMQCTVSWNHIIDDAMNRGKVAAAVKFYNEMKKRAQPPDAYTYTTLLRGLAATKYPQNVSRALLIYNSMYAANSPVTPNIIHTNAVLKVCASHNDIDSLFGVAARLPTTGRGAPDKWTYTTIFTALRNQLWSSLEANAGNTLEQRERKRQEALLRGRRIWGDFVGRWCKGEVLVDEPLVCSMGRLLLLGSRPEDFDDILSLLEQTLGIPRQIPRLGHPDRTTHLKPAQINSMDTNRENVDEENIDQDQHADSTVSSLPSMVDPVAYSQAAGSEFDPLPASIRSFAKAGRSTLSLVLDACIRMRLSSAANAYRKLLTSPTGEYRVLPDTENLHMYLRVLRQSRSSRNAVALVEDMIAHPPLGVGVEAKTFRIAMSCCIRDNSNPATVEQATKLFHMMINSLEEPDFKVSEMFVDVIGHKETSWRDTLRGLREIEIVIRNWRSLLAYGSFPSTAPESITARIDRESSLEADAIYKHEADLDDSASHREKQKLKTIRPVMDHSTGKIRYNSQIMVGAFIARVIGAYDRLLYNAREEMSHAERSECKNNMRQLQIWVTRNENTRRGQRKEGRLSRLAEGDQRRTAREEVA